MKNYADLLDSGLDYDTNLDFENLQHAGDGVVVFIVMAVIFNLAAMVSLYGPLRNTCPSLTWSCLPGFAAHHARSVSQFLSSLFPLPRHP